MSMIRTHKERVEAANRFIKQEKLKLSVWDREAFVEFYLVEDIYNDYCRRLMQANSSLINAKTPIAKRINSANVRIFTSIVEVFDMLIENIKGLISRQYYTAVWSAIPERKLAALAKSPKKLEKLYELSKLILDRTSRDSEKSAHVSKLVDELVEDFDINDSNASLIGDYAALAQTDELLAKSMAALQGNQNFKELNKQQDKKEKIQPLKSRLEIN